MAVLILKITWVGMFTLCWSGWPSQPPNRASLNRQLCLFTKGGHLNICTWDYASQELVLDDALGLTDGRPSGDTGTEGDDSCCTGHVQTHTLASAGFLNLKLWYQDVSNSVLEYVEELLALKPLSDSGQTTAWRVGDNQTSTATLNFVKSSVITSTFSIIEFGFSWPWPNFQWFTC